MVILWFFAAANLLITGWNVVLITPETVTLYKLGAAVVPAFASGFCSAMAMRVR